jgi:hypothetical protein
MGRLREEEEEQEGDDEEGQDEGEDEALLFRDAWSFLLHSASSGEEGEDEVDRERVRRVWDAVCRDGDGDVDEGGILDAVRAL